MSTTAPQVLSRRTNGVHSAAASQTHESARSKGAADAGATRSGRGKAASDKHSEAKSTNGVEMAKTSRTKTPNEGDKVVIRRLPPGMTQVEFVTILGPEWDVGNGKVDWFSYAIGKISHDPSKPSRPGRAYLHLTRKDYIMPLSEVVRSATWEDAKCTFTSPSLIGPPSLEFAIYKKVPGAKKRTDARQGTIDQDPEFMSFLEGLANPAPMRESIDNEDTDETAEAKVTTTPLIEYLREKRANKVKEASAAKSAKHSRQEAATSKSKSATKEDDGSKKKGKESKSARSDKAPSKETVKILTKKAATEQAVEAAKNAASQINTSSSNSNVNANAAEATPAKSRRAGIAAAARILQRDLGLSPGSAHRRARQDAAKAEADSKVAVNNKDSTPAASETQPPPAPATEVVNSQPPKAQSSTSATQKSQPSGRKNRGGKNTDKGKAADATAAQSSTTTAPVILKKKSGASAEVEAPKATADTPATSQQSNAAKSSSNTSNGPKGSSNKSSSSSQKKPTGVSANATRGFVKHANPSQGITEGVLKEALQAFGTITFVEMDKRKGFAYVDFAEHAGLLKAISASPISVAQGTVQVLERKDKKPTATGTTGGGAATAGGPTNSTGAEKNAGRGRRGRGGGGGGKGNAATNGSQAAATTNGASSTANGGG